MTQVSDIKDASKAGKLLIGWNSVKSAIQSGLVKKVFLSSTVQESVENDVESYSKIGGFPVEKFSGDAYELGVLCKKPFPVTVLGIKE